MLVIVAAVAVGPRVLGLVPVDRLRQIVGGGLLLVGAFWTIQSAVRPDGAARELTHEMLTAQRWALRGPLAAAVISGKTVLIEGTEAAVLIVAIGSPQRAFGAAWTGTTAAVAVVIMVAIASRRQGSGVL